MVRPLGTLITLFVLAFTRASAAQETARPLLRIEGREETYGLLCCPQHAIGYYAVELLNDGTLRSAINGYPGTQNPAGAPTFELFSGRIDRSELETLRRLFIEARIGHQTSCELRPHTAYLFFASASADPVQRLTWFGKGTRKNAFGLEAGPDCPAPVVEIASRLRDAFRTLIEAEQERPAIP
jgi:hypothetical protein